MSGVALPGQTYPSRQLTPTARATDTNPPPSKMGTCRSSCSHSGDLEYYDAWRKDPVRSPDGLSDMVCGGALPGSAQQPIRGGRRSAAVVRNRPLVQRSARRHTKLWVCDRGCCSIRWKLDYAEFQSYTKYAEISPYVVEQENHDGCKCLICKGLSDHFLQCRPDQHQSRLGLSPATPSETDEDDEDHGDSDILHGPTVRRPVLSPAVA